MTGAFGNDGSGAEIHYVKSKEGERDADGFGEILSSLSLVGLIELSEK